MIRIALIGVGTAILAAWVKNIKPEYALWITIASGIILAVSTITKLEMIIGELKNLQGYFSGYGAYFKILIKIIGITYLAEFSSGLCKDAGAVTMAGQIELFGKLSILVLCIPIRTSLLKTVDYFLGG